MTEQELKEIEDRVEKATPGPWKSDNCGDVWTEAEKEYCPGMEQNLFSTIGTTRCGPDRGDAEFIAHARQDIPKLLAEFKRLILENKQLLNESDYLKHEFHDYVFPAGK